MLYLYFVYTGLVIHSTRNSLTLSLFNPITHPRQQLSLFLKLPPDRSQQRQDRTLPTASDIHDVFHNGKLGTTIYAPLITVTDRTAGPLTIKNSDFGCRQICAIYWSFFVTLRHEKSGRNELESPGRKPDRSIFEPENTL